MSTYTGRGRYAAQQDVDSQEEPPLAANILCGHASTATTLLTIPATRTWQGWVSLNATLVAAASAAAVTTTAAITVAGTGVTPAAGTILTVGVATPIQQAGTTAQVSNATEVFVTVIAGSGAATLVLAVNSCTQVFASAQGVLLPVAI